MFFTGGLCFTLFVLASSIQFDWLYQRKFAFSTLFSLYFSTLDCFFFYLVSCLACLFAVFFTRSADPAGPFFALDLLWLNVVGGAGGFVVWHHLGTGRVPTSCLVSLKRWTCAGLIILFCDKNGCGIQKVASTHPPTHPPIHPSTHPTPFITSQLREQYGEFAGSLGPHLPEPHGELAHGSEPHDSPALSAPMNYVSEPCSEFATFLFSSRSDLFGEFAAFVRPCGPNPMPNKMSAEPFWQFPFTILVTALS